MRQSCYVPGLSKWYYLTYVDDTSLAIEETADHVTYTSRHTVADNVKTPIIVQLNDVIYCFWWDSVDDKIYVEVSSDGTNWVQHVTAGAVLGAAGDKVIDAFRITATNYLWLKDDPDAEFYSFTVAAGVLTLTAKDSVTAQDIDTSGDVTMYAGNVFGSDYWCFIEHTTTSIYSFDGATLTAETAYGNPTNFASVNPDIGVFIKTQKTIIMCDQTNIQRFLNDTWEEITITPADSGNIAVVYDDDYNAQYLIFREANVNGNLRIYHVGLNGALNLTDNLGDVWLHGMEYHANVFHTRDAVDGGGNYVAGYELDDTALTTETEKVIDKHRKAISFECRTEVSTLTGGRYYLLEDSSNNLYCIGQLKEYSTNIAATTRLKFVSHVEEDLKRSVFEDYSAQTVQAILQDVLEKYAYNIGITSLFAVGGAHTVSFRGKSVRAVIKWVELISNKMVWITPAGYLTLDAAATDSDKDATDALDNITKLETTEINLPWNAVELTGGFVNGVLIKSYAKADDTDNVTYTPFRMSMSECINQTVLDALATSILTNLSTYARYKLTVKGIGRIQVGHTVTINSTKHGVANAEYIVMSSIYEPYGVGLTTMECYNAIFYTDKPDVRDEIFDNKQLAGQNAYDLRYSAQTLGGTKTFTDDVIVDRGASDAFLSLETTGQYRGVKLTEGDANRAIFEYDATNNFAYLYNYQTAMYIKMYDSGIIAFEDNATTHVGIGVTGTRRGILRLYGDGGANDYGAIQCEATEAMRIYTTAILTQIALRINAHITATGHKAEDIGEVATSFDDVYADDFNNTSEWVRVKDPIEAIMKIVPGKTENGILHVDHKSMPPEVRMIQDSEEQELEEVITEWDKKLQKNVTKVQKRLKRVKLFDNKGHEIRTPSDECYSINKLQNMMVQGMQQQQQKIELLEKKMDILLKAIK
jgi:hypothetical protein